MKQEMVKTLLLASMLAMALCGCEKKPSSEATWTVGGEDRLGQMCVRLNSKYKRGLDKNDFSLYYQPKYPSTVVIQVRYKETSDVPLVRKIANAATIHVKGYASVEFGLDVSTEVDMKPLE